MSSKEIREKFLEFFERRGHAPVPSSSLIPDDPSVLLTTAGMQQFKNYYENSSEAKEKFGSLNVASVQKSFRTSDIDEIGDESHLTFFEMLGNFSFGGYFKEEAIKYAYEFITEELGLKIDYVTVFEGDEEVPADGKSEEIWRSLGIKDIRKFGREDNFWGPTGQEGPCGPTTEIFIGNVEIWNLVFNEFYCAKDKTLTPLKTPGVDTGMGLERLAMAVQKTPTIFETDLFSPVTEKLGELSNKTKRIIADHTRAIAFLISDGVRPSNSDSGYILRRIIRRTIIFNEDIESLLRVVVEEYKDFYPELSEATVLEVYRKEKEVFSKTLKKGLKKLEDTKALDAKSAFDLYQTYGLPYEVIKDVAKDKAKGLRREDFDKEAKKHQEVSRAGSEQKFKGGLADHDPRTIRLHTAHHLLLAALKQVLGPHVKQRGSNITSERLRLDFSHPAKLTEEEKNKVENIVNQKIKEGLDVVRKEMPKDEAVKIGAEMEFGGKYGDTVSVYIINNKDGSAFSKEFCGGPHVSNTREIGEFKITKEKAVSAGIRRIRATCRSESSA